MKGSGGGDRDQNELELLAMPAGFRFHPTDEELVTHYLCRKCAHQPIAVPIIADVDLYKFDPWHLPGMALYGEKEWYFFSPRDRKYPNGSRPNRAAGTGYWKATGADKPVGKPKTLGIKKALVFYSGKPPKGLKTNWIMHEYRLANVDRSPTTTNNKHNSNLRLDDWVLCRIYNKKGIIEKHHGATNHQQQPASVNPEEYFIMEKKPQVITTTTTHMQHNMNHHQIMVAPATLPPPPMNEYDDVHFDSPETVPRLHTESSSSESEEEQVLMSPADYQLACTITINSYTNSNDNNKAEEEVHDMDTMLDYLDYDGFQQQQDPFPQLHHHHHQQQLHYNYNYNYYDNTINDPHHQFYMPF